MLIYALLSLVNCWARKASVSVHDVHAETRSNPKQCLIIAGTTIDVVVTTKVALAIRMPETQKISEEKPPPSTTSSNSCETEAANDTGSESVASSKVPRSRRPRNRSKAKNLDKKNSQPASQNSTEMNDTKNKNDPLKENPKAEVISEDSPATTPSIEHTADSNVQSVGKKETKRSKPRKRYQHKVTQRRSEIDALKSSKNLRVFQIEPELFQLLLSPSDPDFPFSIPVLSFDLHISRHYPNQGPLPWIEIKNEDIPKGNSANIENGFRKYEGTLINRVNLLDKNLELLLTLPPAKVITFVRAAKKEATTVVNGNGITARPESNTGNAETKTASLKSVDSDPLVSGAIENQNDSESKVVAENSIANIEPKLDNAEPSQNASESDEPDIFGYSSSSSDSSDDEAYAHSSDDEDIDAGAGSASSSTTSGPKREGTELMFPDIELVNIALCEILSLNIVFQCGRCKAAHTFTNLQSAEYGKPTKPRAELCGKCDLPLMIAFRKQFVHSMCQTAGYLDVEGGKVLDLLPSTYSAMCGSCQTVAPPFKNMDLGAQRMVICRNCHTKMLMKIELFDFILLSTESLGSDAKKAEKAKLGPSAPKQKLNLIGGEPLPNFGACQHYRKSTRWFRFACCQRVFACDACHDVEMQHPCELASRMLCGYCSREQRFSAKCHYCDHDYTHRTSRFWEGGKGVRDRKLMSRKDKRKYKRDGSEKTKKEVHFQGKSKAVSHS